MTNEFNPALLETPEIRSALTLLYGEAQLSEQTARYQNVLDTYAQTYGAEPVKLFSAPGRTEIGGNHTDHNHGKVLTGSIDLDTIAAAAKVEENVITLRSEGYEKQYSINLDQLHISAEDDGTAGLIRGIASGFVEKGYRIGGFNAYVSSNVYSASGLSSSASFEMLVCTILNTFYNEGKLSAVEMGKIGKYAENKFWNKPSGLLDQIACAHGGLISIDFENPEEPQIEPVTYRFDQDGYALVIVNTGGNHADLTEDYAAVPEEMFAVAELLGSKYCRGTSPDELYARLPEIREKAGDRAVLRALHFFEENDRVDGQLEALRNNDLQAFLPLITESGNSSWKWLQNVYRPSVTRQQEVAIALAITERYIKQLGKGACRVHGGGFAGVILAILPQDAVKAYQDLIQSTLGTESLEIQVRAHGAVCLDDVK
ncbi:galactokinase [Saccharibacillus endophyticus]|uniref:Galactokinase n=1 Tax=Saccharibacillus endophyticus TaxID=2060666 RepID=A0ABQ1ZZU4_9BACL|nr:galactokinase family protein [Saccharibacillus endophyticus]GGH83450.1 galactokinase [Saccharibacillus endophyticus]